MKNLRNILFILSLLLIGGGNVLKAETYTVTYSSGTGSYTQTNPNGNWGRTWVSTATNPQVTFGTTANNIDVSTGYIYSGSSGCTYTLTAQDGYVITGYTIVGKAQTSDQTLTPAAGGSAVTFSTDKSYTLEVTGLGTAATSFTQSTPNKGIAITSFTIYLKDADYITGPTQLSNSKLYTIQCPRGYLTLNTAQTALVSSHTSGGSSAYASAATDDASRQFGIMNIDGSYYIYSPKLKKFGRLEDQSLVFYADRGTALSFTKDGKDGIDGSVLRMVAQPFGLYMNNNNGGNIVINGYTTSEGGNTFTIREVENATLDEDEALEVFKGASPILDPHKVYKITNPRNTTWTANSQGTGITGTIAYTTATEAEQEFAFFKYNGKFHLYNVGTQKFVSKTGSLTTDKADFATIEYRKTSNASYPYMFYIVDNDYFFNAQNSANGGGFAVNSWKSADEGNQHQINPVADTDVYEDMLDFFEAPYWDVTYNLYFKGSKIGETVVNTRRGSDAALPASYSNAFCSFSYSPTTINTGTTSVDVTITWNGPVTLADDYASIEWKNLYIDRGEDKFYLSNTGSAPSYLIKNPSDKQLASEAYQWGFVGNPYQMKVYNKQSGSTQTLHPNNTIEMADGDSYWSIKVSYGGGFMIGKTGDVNSFINQNGGASSLNLGYWGSTTDLGNVFKISNVPEIPVTNVYFDIYYGGREEPVATGYVAGLEVGDELPEIPSTLTRDYVTLRHSATGTVTENMRIPVTATWNGPFELSEDFASAHWYDMAIRETWYVTSDNKEDDGALSTVNANAIGLGEDAYQWAFVGDPWHIQVFNKAEGSTKNFGYPTQSNQGIPSFEADTYYWTIKQSTTSIPNAFVMNVGGTNLYINQYGGAGGSLKFWDSGNNLSDKGSAFTVFEVPTDYSSYVISEITPYVESDADYFVLKPAVLAAIGYNPDYKTNCPFATYKSMKEQLLATDLTDLNNYVLPDAGYYRIDNKMASKNTYNGHHTYIRNITGRVYSHYEDDNYDGAYTLVKLEKNPSNASQWAFKLQGKYLTATGASAGTNYVGASETPFYFNVSISNLGYGVFQSSEAATLYLHSNAVYADWGQAGEMIAYAADGSAEASNWEFFPANSFPLTISSAGYATLYVPFPVTIPSGVKAYRGKFSASGKYLDLKEISGTIPAATAVILEGEAGTYTFNIADDVEAVENDLKGVYTEGKPDGALTLQIVDDVLGFYTFDSSAIGANKAYLTLPANVEVKGVQIRFDGEDSVRSIEAGSTQNAVYNLSGQRMKQAVKGVYIVNGKKVVIK